MKLQSINSLDSSVVYYKQYTNETHTHDQNIEKWEKSIHVEIQFKNIHVCLLKVRTPVE